MFTAQGIVKPKRLEFDKQNRSEYYGKLSVGPFERGFGVTIGNSLRRMLLSSIEGAAVVAVKFEGIFHEFSSITFVEFAREQFQQRGCLQLFGNSPFG